jgi:hypothetical protein
MEMKPTWLPVSAWLAAHPSAHRGTVYAQLKRGAFGEDARLTDGHYQIRSDAEQPATLPRGAKAKGQTK